MKKIFFLLLILSFIILSIFKVDANNLTYPLIGKTIVIDPGHGGVDAGASYGEVLEKDLNLAISLKLKTELEKNGAIVFITRDGDYDLSKPNAIYRKKSDFDNRIKLINNSGSDMYLSIHLNYFGNAIYSGPQVFYTTGLKENEKMAEAIQKELNNELKSNRKIRINSSANYMYGKLNVKGVLVECGFLSNYNERNNLIKEAYQEKLALIITNAIINYYIS